MSLQDMLDGAAAGETTVEEGWGQGRATYGGLVAGLLLARATAAVPGEPGAVPLRSLAVSFVAPVAPGPAAVAARVLRSGSSSTQVSVELTQEGRVGAAALATFGAARPSVVAVAAPSTMPQLPDPDGLEPYPYIPGMTPDFFAKVELRQCVGDLPYTGSERSEMGGWMRFREAPPRFDATHLVSVADAWPPAVLPLLPTFAPASTVAWTIEVVGDPGAAPDTHWAYHARTEHAADGYAHTDARIWHPDGRLVALSRQTITVFG